MHAQKPHGRFSNRVARIHFVPRVSELLQSVERLRDAWLVKRAVAVEARNRGRALDFGRPPHEHG